MVKVVEHGRTGVICSTEVEHFRVFSRQVEQKDCEKHQIRAVEAVFSSGRTNRTKRTVNGTLLFDCV
jgi:hypothetical protein